MPLSRVAKPLHRQSNSLQSRIQRSITLSGPAVHKSVEENISSGSAHVLAISYWQAALQGDVKKVEYLESITEFSIGKRDTGDGVAAGGDFSDVEEDSDEI